MASTTCVYKEEKIVAARKDKIRIPQETLHVSRARYQLTRLLRRLRNSPRVYWITQSGRPAGALVNFKWLEALLAQAKGKRAFTLFGQAWASRDWEMALKEFRQTLPGGTLGRHITGDR
jgi:hypothetical protein